MRIVLTREDERIEYLTRWESMCDLCISYGRVDGYTLQKGVRSVLTREDAWGVLTMVGTRSLLTRQDKRSVLTREDARGVLTRESEGILMRGLGVHAREDVKGVLTREGSRSVLTRQEREVFLQGGWEGCSYKKKREVFL